MQPIRSMWQRMYSVVISIQHTDGLTRDVLEQLWADKAGQIGFTRCEYLDVDHGSVESLVRYISKNKRCARS